MSSVRECQQQYLELKRLWPSVKLARYYDQGNKVWNTRQLERDLSSARNNEQPSGGKNTTSAEARRDNHNANRNLHNDDNDRSKRRRVEAEAETAAAASSSSSYNRAGTRNNEGTSSWAAPDARGPVQVDFRERPRTAASSSAANKTAAAKLSSGGSFQMSAETKQFIEESRSNRDGGAAGAPRGPVALPPGWGNQSAGASASFGSFGRVKNEDEQNKWPRQQMKQNEPHGRSNKSDNVKREQYGEGERTPAWLKEVKSAVGVNKDEDQQQLAEQLQLHPSLLKAAPLRRGKMVAVVVDFDLSTRTGEISSEDIKATLRTVKTVAFSGPAMNKAEKHGEEMKDFFIGDKVLFDRLIFDDKGNPKAMGVEKFVEVRTNATTRSTADAQPAQRNAAHESTSSRARDHEQVGAPVPTRGAASGAAASSSGPSAGEKPARKPMAAIRFNDLPVEKKFPGYVGKTTSATDNPSSTTPATAVQLQRPVQLRPAASSSPQQQLSAGTTPSTYSGSSGVQLKRGPRSANDGTDTTNQRDRHQHQHEHQNLGPSGRVRDIARVVKWYEKKGYGYIESDQLYNQFNGQVFVHCHDLDNPEEEMREGDEVYYGKLAFNDRQQPFATGVRLVHARAARAKTSVFFSNVEFRKSEADLMDFFLQNCGLISHFKLFLDPVGRSRGQGVVRFADEVGYDKALALHDTRVSSGDTRLICIEPSRFAIPIGASDGVDAISVGMEEDRDDHDNAEDNGAAGEKGDDGEEGAGRKRTDAGNKKKDVENFLRKDRFPAKGGGGGQKKRRGRW